MYKRQELKIIKANNLTEKFKTELFISYQYSEDETNRTAIGELIDQLKNTDLQNTFDKKYGFKTASENRMYQLIEELSNVSDLDKDKLAFSIFSKTMHKKKYEGIYKPIRALNYFLKNGTPEQRKSTIATFINGDTLTVNCDTDISDFPEEILEFKDIKNITIAAPLTSFPKVITKMTAVKRLRLLHIKNGIDTLPKEITNLTALEELELCNVDFNTIPDQLTQLKKLKKIHYNSFTTEEFPLVFTKIATLESLYTVSYTHLTLPTTPYV